MIADYTIIITTYNRVKELKVTLAYFRESYPEATIIVSDDASSDDTVTMISNQFPDIRLIANKTNMGLIHNRNLMLQEVKTPYVISIDDDAHFLTTDNFEKIKTYFLDHKKCAVVSFRIFWGLNEPTTILSNQTAHPVRDFAGGAHAMRLTAWNEIPEYPAWYRFYGEEQFASLQFFKKGWQVHYLPSILVHHRVEVKKRKKDQDYVTRTSRSLHAAWSNYLIFLPLKQLPKKIAYSIYQQLRLKVLKGDFKAARGLLIAIFKTIVNLPLWWKKRNPLSDKQYDSYLKTPALNLYWDPNKENRHQ